MLKRVVRLISLVLGGLVGLGVANTIVNLELLTQVNEKVLYGTAGIIFGIIFLFLTDFFVKTLRKLIHTLEKEIFTLDTKEIIFSTIGFTIGMLIALLISNIFKLIPIAPIGLVLTVITYIILGYLGISIPRNYITNIDLLQYFPIRNKEVVEKTKKCTQEQAQPKVVDTSVIIDGRILDIIQTGFIEGALVIPNFVLEELQHIADSADDLKRKKGRRGLDILKNLMDNPDINVEVSDQDFENMEVDSKLLKLAIELNGSVLTNDYNLNKVALVQNVKVLNINELANAVKPVVIPGETFEVDIIQKGKGNKQGVGYLDDGTMIVVEDGEKFIGQRINSMVTSVLQTDAGRMIFVKPIS